MTQYLLTVHGPVDPEEMTEGMTEADIQARYDAVEVFNDELRASGAWVFAGGLEPAHTATVVDATGDAPITTDGPYLESKELIGGFWIVEVADLDSALELARKGSAACEGAVEVRPFQSA